MIEVTQNTPFAERRVFTTYTREELAALAQEVGFDVDLIPCLMCVAPYNTTDEAIKEVMREAQESDTYKEQQADPELKRQAIENAEKDLVKLADLREKYPLLLKTLGNAGAMSFIETVHMISLLTAGSLEDELEKAENTLRKAFQNMTPEEVVAYTTSHSFDEVSNLIESAQEQPAA